MKLIAKALAWILGVVVSLTLVAYANAATTLNSQYVLNQAESAGVYKQVAADLPDTLGKLTPLTGVAKYELGQIINASYVRQLADSLVPQLVAYFRGSHRQPQADLRDIVDRAGPEVSLLPPALVGQINHPISLGNSKLDLVASWIQRLDELRLFGPLVAAGLGLLIWFVAGHRRFVVLAESMVAALVVLGMLWAIDKAIPPLVSSAVTTSPLAPLTDPVTAWVRSVLQGTEHIMLLEAIGLGVAAVGLGLAHTATKMFGRGHHE